LRLKKLVKGEGIFNASKMASNSVRACAHHRCGAGGRAHAERVGRSAGLHHLPRADGAGAVALDLLRFVRSDQTLARGYLHLARDDLSARFCRGRAGGREADRAECLSGAGLHFGGDDGGCACADAGVLWERILNDFKVGLFKLGTDLFFMYILYWASIPSG